jgi:hypothetical protein
MKMYFLLEFPFWLSRGYRMAITPIKGIFCCFLLLCAAACILQPVLAATGTITIAYRGSGAGYIGDTFIFDGRNTYGNTTLLTITGVGLPSEGVPVGNLNGMAGTGTPVGVDPDGRWKYVWYASGVSGLEQLQTSRYTITATDSENPGRTATTMVSLRKPAFYITAIPNPSNPGRYVELIGSAEQGITFAKIDIADASGRVLHTFTSPVSSSGYLSYGFHVDMEPGQYTVTLSNPSLRTPYRTVLSVTPPEGAMPVTPVETTGPKDPVPTQYPTAETVTAAAGTPVARTPVAPVTILAALTAGISAAVLFRRL